MKNNWKKLTCTFLSVAMAFAVSLPIAAAERVPSEADGSAPAPAAVSAYYDDDYFQWDEVNPNAIRDFFRSLGERLAETDRIEDQQVPLAASPAELPAYYDDDLFQWDDNAQIAAWVRGILLGE